MDANTKSSTSSNYTVLKVVRRLFYGICHRRLRKDISKCVSQKWMSAVDQNLFRRICFRWQTSRAVHSLTRKQAWKPGRKQRPRPRKQTNRKQPSSWNRSNTMAILRQTTVIEDTSSHGTNVSRLEIRSGHRPRTVHARTPHTSNGISGFLGKLGDRGPITMSHDDERRSARSFLSPNNIW